MFEELKKRLRKKQEESNQPSKPEDAIKPAEGSLIENVTKHEDPDMLAERKRKEEEFRKKRNNPFN